MDILVANLFSLMLLPRLLVFKIIKIFYKFYEENFSSELLYVNSFNCNKHVNNIVTVMQNVFNNYSTEHFTFTQMKKLYYVEPKSVKLTTVLHYKKINKFKRKTQKVLYAQIIILNENYTKIFFRTA